MKKFFQMGTNLPSGWMLLILRKKKPHVKRLHNASVLLYNEENVRERAIERALRAKKNEETTV